MVDIDYIKGWLDFQSLDDFRASADVLEKWIYLDKLELTDEDSVDDELELPDLDDYIPKLDVTFGVENLKNDTTLVNEVGRLKLDDNTYRAKQDPYISAESKIISTTKNINDESLKQSLKQPNEIENNIRNANIEESEPQNEELSLSESPKFKKASSHPTLYKSPSTPSNFLREKESEITFYADINMIKDKTWLPRHHQHHKVKQRLLQTNDSPYQYIKNSVCPKSRSSDGDLGGYESLSNYRYSRRTKTTNQVEVMCRLCRGVNWVRKSMFKTHMAFSHGVLLPKRGLHSKTNPILLPVPKSLMISKSERFSNFFVKCPACDTWIKLGAKGDRKTSSSATKSGLYFNYFSHHLKNHKSTYLKESI